MSFTVSLNLPKEIEEQLRAEPHDFDVEVTEAYALELFRQGRLSHYALARVLGLDRFETDAFLKRHNVFEGSLTAEDMTQQSRAMERVMGKTREAGRKAAGLGPGGKAGRWVK